MVASCTRVILERIARIDIGHQTSILRIQDLELKVESMEHWLNQQSILVDTLISVIMGTYELSKPDAILKSKPSGDIED